MLEQSAKTPVAKVLATSLVCAGYYVGGAIACTLKFEPGGISGIWLPHGILLAALLLSPLRLWWLYAVALVPTHFHLVRTFQGPVPLVVMLIQLGGNVTQAVVPAAVLRRILGDPPRLSTLSRMGALLLIGAFLAPCLVSAGVASLFVITHWVGDFWIAWQRRTFCVMSAAVIVTAPIIHLATGDFAAIRRASRHQIAELSLLSIGLLLVLRFFGGDAHQPWLLFVPLPFLLWSAVRFGPSGLGLHLLAVMVITLISAMGNRGPFAGAAQIVVALNGYILAFSIPLMLLAALVQQYEQSQRRYRSVVEDQTELICRFLSDGTLTFVNGAYCRYFGCTRAELIGQTFWHFLPMEQHERSRALLTSITPDHPVASIEYEVTKPNGEVGWHHWIDRGFFDEAGHAIEFQAVGHDITERKRAEEQQHQLAAQTQVAEALQEVDRRKNVFLATLAHELRNPLAPITTAVEILGHARAGDSTTRAREIIARQTAQLTQLVDDLLDVSRITQDKIKLNLLVLDLAQVVAQAVETTRAPFEARKHHLSIELPDQTLPVLGDRVRLIQIVTNLLNNAAKYTADGGRITLRVNQADSQIVMTVTDNGIGMPVQMLERVFDMFTQLDAPSAQRDGLGIGLALVKRLVEMHGGAVEARSDGPGRGSEFVVRLPIADALQLRQNDSIVGERDADRLHAKRKRILVVDDNVDAAETLSVLLQLQQHEVQVAHDGVVALARARTMDPDVVFLDIDLPMLNGYEVARQLRQKAEGTRPLLVALTGFGQAEDRERTTAAGFHHHFVKPIELPVIQSLLAVSRERPE